MLPVSSSLLVEASEPVDDDTNVENLYISELNKQAKILAYMFRIVENGKVTVPLYDPNNVSNPNVDNRSYLLEFIGGLLKQAYPHLLEYV